MPGIASYKTHEIVFVFMKKYGPDNYTNYDIAQLFKAEFPRRVTRLNKSNDFGPNQAKYILQNQHFKAVWNQWLAGDAQVLAEIDEFYATNDTTCYPNGRLPGPPALQYNHGQASQFGATSNMSSITGGYLGNGARLGMGSQEGNWSYPSAPEPTQIFQNQSHGNGHQSYVPNALDFEQLEDTESQRLFFVAAELSCSNSTAEPKDNTVGAYRYGYAQQEDKDLETSAGVNAVDNNDARVDEESAGQPAHQSLPSCELGYTIPQIPEECEMVSRIPPNSTNIQPSHNLDEDLSQNQLLDDGHGGLIDDSTGIYNPFGTAMSEHFGNGASHIPQEIMRSLEYIGVPKSAFENWSQVQAQAYLNNYNEQKTAEFLNRIPKTQAPVQQEQTLNMNARPQGSGYISSTPSTPTFSQQLQGPTPNMGSRSQSFAPQLSSSQPFVPVLQNQNRSVEMQRKDSQMEMSGFSEARSMNDTWNTSTSLINQGSKTHFTPQSPCEMAIQAHQQSTIVHGNALPSQMDSNQLSNILRPVRKPTPAEEVRLHHLIRHGNEAERKGASQVVTMLSWSASGNSNRKRAASLFFLMNAAESHVRKLKGSFTDHETLRNVQSQQAKLLSEWEQVMQLIRLEQQSGASKPSMAPSGHQHIQSGSIDHAQTATSQVPNVLAAAPVAPHPDPQAAFRLPRGPSGVSKPMTPAQKEMLQEQVRAALLLRRATGGQLPIFKNGRIQRRDASNGVPGMQMQGFKLPQSVPVPLQTAKEAPLASQPMDSYQQTPSMPRRINKTFTISGALLDDTYSFPDETVFSGTLIDDRKWRVQGVLAKDAPDLVCTCEGIELHFFKPVIHGWLSSYIEREWSKGRLVQNEEAQGFSPQPFTALPESHHTRGHSSSTAAMPQPDMTQHLQAESSMAATGLGISYLPVQLGQGQSQGRPSQSQIQAHGQARPQATTQGLGIDFLGRAPSVVTSTSTSGNPVGSVSFQEPQATTPKPRAQKRMGEPMTESRESKKAKHGKESSGISKAQVARNEAAYLAQPHVQAEFARSYPGAYSVDPTTWTSPEMDCSGTASQVSSQQSTNTGYVVFETPQKQIIGVHDMSRQSSSSTTRTLPSYDSAQVFTPSTFGTSSPASSAASPTPAPRPAQRYDPIAEQQVEQQNALVATETAQANEEAEREAKEEADAEANEEEYDPIVAMEWQDMNNNDIEADMFFGQDMDSLFGDDMNSLFGDDDYQQ